MNNSWEIKVQQNLTLNYFNQNNNHLSLLTIYLLLLQDTLFGELIFFFYMTEFSSSLLFSCSTYYVFIGKLNPQDFSNPA
ncbi:hypothetical protein pb186bvf_010887 [Paramecium bursaria]